MWYEARGMGPDRERREGSLDMRYEVGIDDDVMEVEEDHCYEIAETRPPYRAVREFEDLVAWQQARSLTSTMFNLTRETPLREHRGICDQLQRASVSIMSNIAEGFERGSAKEYHRHLLYAKASCAEVRSLLYVAYDNGFIDKPSFERSMTDARSVARVVGGLRASISRYITNNQSRN